MNHVKVLLALTAGLLVGLFVGVGIGTRPVEAQAPAVRQWEYKTLIGSLNYQANAGRDLNKAGQEGWEYAGTLYGNPGERAYGVLMKRAKR